MSKSFITTPIFYVNAAPHIGHLYTAVLADAAHRWKCMVGGASGCVLSTGTDEHGIKIQQAAAKRGRTPQAHCDEISPQFEKLFRKANINYTHFIRTTSTQHKSLVQDMWTRLWDRGWIYKGSYEGWYSVPDECFLSNKQVKQVSNVPSANGDNKVSVETVSIETGHSVEWSSEVNYMFKLSAFKEQLLDWIDSTPYPIYPEIYRQLVLQWVDEGLSDLSVSRPTSRLNWGVAVPGDQSQKIYVWLDALVNYLTVSGYPHPDHHWPATAHIVGKDILRFHAIYWPAFLLAAGLQLPKRIIGHAHWTIDKHKMSKSIGNVVDPVDSLDSFGIDPLRYFLLKESSLHQDGDYSSGRVAATLNSDLADTLGNLLQRVTSHKLHPPKVKGQPDPIGDSGRGWSEEDRDLIDAIDKLPNIVGQFYNDYEFGSGIHYIMETLHMTNRFLNNHKPWILVTHPDQHDHLRDVLALSIKGLKICTHYLGPVMPGSCDEILTRLGGPPGGHGHPVTIGGQPVFMKIKDYY